MILLCIMYFCFCFKDCNGGMVSWLATVTQTPTMSIKDRYAVIGNHTKANDTGKKKKRIAHLALFLYFLFVRQLLKKAHIFYNRDNRTTFQQFNNW